MIGSILVKLIVAARLSAAIVSTWPEVPPERAASASLAIVLEHGDHEPALLAALFAPESGFDFRKVNPTSGACGIGQVLYSHDRAVQARRCRAVLASERAGVHAAVRKLDDARAYCYRRGTPTLVCAITGYRSGPAGVRGRWWSGARATIERRDAVRRAMGKRPGATTEGGAA